MVKSGTGLINSSKDMRKIKEVRLSVFDPEELKAYSVAEVRDPNFIDKEENKQVDFSVADQRMGPALKFVRCKTCDCDLINCPGHFGHMVLAKPVYHFGFLEVLKKVLSCICYKCSKLKPITNKETLKKFEKIKENKNTEKRLNELYKMLSGVKTCASKQVNANQQMNNEDGEQQTSEGGCGAKQPKYTVDKKEKIGITQIFEERPEGYADNKIELSAEDAKKILDKISDEDMKVLGFDPQYNRPKNLILTIFPVAPPQVRPTVDRGGGMYSEDDLTYQYQSILKCNLQLKQSLEKGEPPHRIKEWVEYLQFLCATLARNDYRKKSTHKNGRPIKSIRDRISSKEGRIRGNLMGKRVDFSARTVISPDPNLALDELGVPRTIAGNLTFPEVVTQRNHEFLTSLVNKDTPWSWPGAKYVKKKTGDVFDLRLRKEMNLEIGDIVERHLLNGDYVLFNRQPSLHKMSMMSHRIRVLPFSSFRLNLSVVKPYNADFDGDEMNMHVPQSYETRAELKEIMYVPRQIVSPKANQPVMGLEQDALTGIRYFSRRTLFLEIDDVMSLVMRIPPELWDGEFNLPQPAIMKPKQLWTGKQIISMILPKISLEAKANSALKEDATLNDTDVLIYKGEHLKGILDNKTVGTSRKGLVHTIWLECGFMRARDFLTDIQQIVNNWLVNHGHTVGICDTIADDETFDKIRATLEVTKLRVDEMISKLQRGDLEFQPGKGLMESFEKLVNLELNDSRDKTGNQLLEKISNRNNILHMVNAGSKGKKENLSQILACVGQQNVEGKRIPFGFQHRSLPHFTKFDYGPKSKGFVEGCYLKGLTPEEFYFHTMGGREGLIDTACKTATTGYIQRRLVKSIEDVMAKYDGTVRDSRGNIIQFLYGEDSMAGEFVEQVIVDLIKKSNDEIEDSYNIFLKDGIMMEEQDEIKLQEELDQLQKDRDQLRRLFPKDFRTDFYLPFDVTRLIKNAKTEFGIRSKDQSDLTVSEAYDMLQECLRKLNVVQGADQLSVNANENATLLLCIYLRSHLATKKVLLTHRFTREAFQFLLGQIEEHFQRAKVHPGEMVGAIAAQSISEPTTQMTLNTFHMAGISAKNVTLGVPRMQEIISKATNIKTPSLVIALNGEQRYDQEFFHTIQHDFTYTKFGDLMLKSEVYFDSDPLKLRGFDLGDEFDEDEDKLQFNLDFEFQMQAPQLYDEIANDPNRLSPWILRVQLKEISNTKAQVVEHLVRDKLGTALRQVHDNLLVLTNLFETAVIEERPPIVCVLLVRSGEPIEREFDIMKRLEIEVLKSLHISGIENIKKVYTKKVKGKDIKVIDPKTGSVVEAKKDEYFYETDGTNLKKAFSFDYVDYRRTTTNDVVEIWRVLGIEACRKSLLGEIRAVMDTYGIYINYRHLAVLCDQMTQRGYIMPINRNGINRIDCGPLRKCSFEETLDMILEASAFGVVDPLSGISENVLLGQLCSLGTGSFDLIVDVQKLKDPRYIPDDFIQHDEVVSEGGDEHAHGGFGGIDSMATPTNINTPGPYQGGMTPFINTPGTTMGEGLGGFTPLPGSLNPLSPSYSPSRTPTNMMSPARGGMSPAYDIQSPIYRPQSPLIGNSPSYTPAQKSGMHYTPISPHYSPSASPSLSSAGGGTKLYSPSSPTYSANSPKYSPRYSPRSPNYSSPSHSNTPGTGAINSSYTPNTPSYNKGVYVPTSPAYDPNRTIHEAEESDEEDGKNRDNE